MNVRMIFKTMSRWCAKNATKLLAGGAILSEMAGFWFMHKEAPIVRDRLDALPEDAKWTEKIKAAGPVYLPAFGMLLLSCGCTIGGCVVGNKQIAVATSLYSASEAALRKLENNMVKELGPEQAQKVHDAVAKEVLAENPVTCNTIYETGKGSDIIYDPLSGRYFRSSPSAVIAAGARLNNKISSNDLNDYWASVNDWYEELGLPTVGLGGAYGWNRNHKFETYQDPQSWNLTTTEDGHAAFVITYHERPVLYNEKQTLNTDIY